MFWSFEEVRLMLGAGDAYAFPNKKATAFVRDGMAIDLWFYRTKLVTYRQDGTFVLNTGGNKSETTKARLNEFSPVEIYQKDGVWYIKSGTEEPDVVFFDGIVVDTFGDVVPQPTRDEKFQNFQDMLAEWDAQKEDTDEYAVEMTRDNNIRKEFL